MLNQRHLFRPQALEHYQHGQATTVLPQFFSVRTFLVGWLLFAVLLVLALLAWTWHIPQEVKGVGTIQNLSVRALAARGLAVPTQGNERTLAIFFFPAQVRPALQVGTPFQVQISGVGHPLIGAVERLESVVLSPAQARQRYQVSEQVARAITTPAAVVLVGFGSVTVPPRDDGSLVDAHLQTNFFTMLSLLDEGT